MSKMTPLYNTVTFVDVWDNFDSFLADYKDCGIPAKLSDDSIKTLFYLLYARYANNPIANRDITQFKYKVCSIIFQYGPTWEKRLEIQDKLRGLTEAEVLQGAKAIYNHAYNPGTDPSTSDLVELTYINDQNTTINQVGKVTAYENLWEMLRTDVTEQFLGQFRKCFKLIVKPENTLLYYDEEEDL